MSERVCDLRLSFPQKSEVWGPLALAGGAADGRALMQNTLSHVYT